MADIASFSCAIVGCLALNILLGILKFEKWCFADHLGKNDDVFARCVYKSILLNGFGSLK